MGVVLAVFIGSYAVGSIPFAYIIVKVVTGEDVTQHGTGNVGAMNVRRSTGSWIWFAIAMVLDAMKGLVPVAVVKSEMLSQPAQVLVPTSELMTQTTSGVTEMNLLPLAVMAAVAGAVVGHNYSCWMALVKKHFSRTGKGLATGAGALLAYDWRYFLIVLIVGLTTIAVTKYMMAGQVSAAVSLPVGAILLGSPDWPFALVMGAFVYAAHHKRFIGMLQGKEPRLYVNDRMGPRG